MTIEIPDQLARRLASEMDQLADIIEQGLASRRSKTSGMWRELVGFLARGPRPEEIIAFRPSRAHAERASDLLDRNGEGSLTPEHEAELEEMASLDNFMLLVKAEARKVLSTRTNG